MHKNAFFLWFECVCVFDQALRYLGMEPLFFCEVDLVEVCCETSRKRSQCCTHIIIKISLWQKTCDPPPPLQSLPLLVLRCSWESPERKESTWLFLCSFNRPTHIHWEEAAHAKSCVWFNAFGAAPAVQMRRWNAVEWGELMKRIVKFTLALLRLRAAGFRKKLSVNRCSCSLWWTSDGWHT